MLVRIEDIGKDLGEASHGSHQDCSQHVSAAILDIAESFSSPPCIPIFIWPDDGIDEDVEVQESGGEDHATHSQVLLSIEVAHWKVDDEDGPCGEDWEDDGIDGIGEGCLLGSG